MKSVAGFSEIQDWHLDAMIRLAFALDEAEEVQQILDEPESELTQQDEEMAKRIFTIAQAKIAREEKAERHRASAARRKHAIVRIMEAAACLILVLSIAMPIAVASSAEFRAKVMQLLVSIDNEHNEAHFQFVEDTDAAFFVPEGWTGEYFPAYIPGQMTESWRSEYIPLIEYGGPEDQGFSFAELTEDAGMAAGTENATIRYADVNGASACIIEGYMQDGETYILTLVWSNDTKWFSLCCNNMEADEALRIARSVKKIIK